MVAEYFSPRMEIFVRAFPAKKVSLAIMIAIVMDFMTRFEPVMEMAS